MPTLEDTIQKVHRRLLSGVREQFVQLTDDYTADDETMVVSGGFSGALQPGAILGVDLEELLVLAVTTSGSISVQGGYNGSTPADHAAGSIMTINPRFSFFDIQAAINDDLLDLSSPDNGLGQTTFVDVTWNPVFLGYDLGSQFDAASSKVLEVSYKIAPPTRTYPLIRKGDWAVRRNQNDPSVFPSGNGIILYKDAWPGLPVHITFLAPFQPLVNLSDDLHTVAGLPTTAVDLPALGAEILLMQPREVKRNFTESQSDPRKAPEVPPQAILGSSKKLEMQRQTRIDAECARIERAWPNAESW